MKKTYITPAMQVYRVQPSQILSLSTSETEITSGNRADFEICTKEEKEWGAGW